MTRLKQQRALALLLIPIPFLSFIFLRSIYCHLTLPPMFTGLLGASHIKTKAQSRQRRCFMPRHILSTQNGAWLVVMLNKYLLNKCINSYHKTVS